MDTYGDLVTLLLCFFVLLFSFSTIDSRKWEALVGAFAGETMVAIPVLSPAMALEKPIALEPQTGETSDDSQRNTATVDIEALMSLAAAIGTFIQENQLEGQVEIATDYENFVLIIRFADAVLFDSGNDVLRPEAMQTLNLLVEALTQNLQYIELIRIEGHTDNLPIRTAKFDSNWELSVFRAVRTLRYLIDSGRIEPNKLSAVGYGEHRPIRTNNTAEGRASNRRVDFVIECTQQTYGIMYMN